MHPMKRAGFGHDRGLDFVKVESSDHVLLVKILFGSVVVVAVMFQSFGYGLLFALYVVGLMVVLLGMVYYDKVIAENIGASFRPSVEDSVDSSLRAVRGEVFKGLQGDVLDLSPGSGFILFRHLVGPKNKVKSVVRFETSEKFVPLADTRMNYLVKDHSIDGTLITDVSNTDNLLLSEKIQGKQFDVIVTYGFLCRVTDIDQQLDRINMFLKPGGTLIYMEHELSTSYPSLIDFQKQVLNKLSQRMCNGCQCGREVVSHIRKRKDWELEAFSIAASDLFPFDNVKIGFAHKVSSQ